MDLRSGTRPDRRAGIFPGKTGPAGPFPAHHPARTGLLPARRVRVRPALYSQAIPGPRAHTAHLQRLHHRGRPPRDRAGHGRLLLGRPVWRGPRIVPAACRGGPLLRLPSARRHTRRAAPPLQPAPPAPQTASPAGPAAHARRVHCGYGRAVRAYFRLYGGRGGGKPPELCPAHHACPRGRGGAGRGRGVLPVPRRAGGPGRRRRIRQDPWHGPAREHARSHPAHGLYDGRCPAHARIHL